MYTSVLYLPIYLGIFICIFVWILQTCLPLFQVYQLEVQMKRPAATHQTRMILPDQPRPPKTILRCGGAPRVINGFCYPMN